MATLVYPFLLRCFLKHIPLMRCQAPFSALEWRVSQVRGDLAELPVQDSRNWKIFPAFTESPPRSLHHSRNFSKSNGFLQLLLVPCPLHLILGIPDGGDERRSLVRRNHALVPIVFVSRAMDRMYEVWTV